MHPHVVSRPIGRTPDFREIDLQHVHLSLTAGGSSQEPYLALKASCA